MHIAKNVIKSFIPLAIVMTLLSGLLYAAVQQVLRQDANEPQIQMAEDTAAALARGASLDAVVPANKVDIAQSLASYVVVFDDSGKAITSSGLLHNQFPSLPAGVLDYVRQNGEDRITWQPEPGVRSAIVVTRYSGPATGFVMAGRSLREVEVRESNLELIVGLGWLATLLAGLGAVIATEFAFSAGGRIVQIVAAVARQRFAPRQEASNANTSIRTEKLGV